MLSNNHKAENDSSCVFAELLVSVLYDEANVGERREFNEHLPTCASCSEELAAFGLVRNAVSEYREKEFSRLLTPQIVLPERRKEVVSRSEQSSRIDSLREFLFPTKNWLQGATAFAGLTICVALLLILGYAILNNSNNQQIARENNLTINAPNNDLNNPKNNPVANSLIESEKQEVKPEVEDSMANQTLVTPARQKAKLKASTSTRSTVRQNLARASKTKSQSTKTQQARQSLNLDFESDGYEDDAPHLSDLLDEIGLVK